MKNYSIPIFIAVLLAVWGCLPSRGGKSSSKIASDSLTIAQGKELFIQNCSACHNFRQRGIGPNLAGVTVTESTEWLASFIANSPQMVSAGDPRAVELFKEFKIPMPPFPTLGENNIAALIAYMHTFADDTAHGPAMGTALKNPVPTPIVSSGITLSAEYFARVPATAELPPVARINKMAPMPGTDRLLIHDLRGKLYEITGDTVSLYMDFPKLREKFIDKPGLGTGLGSFAFHPDFLSNGLFYTTHTEPAGTSPADFDYEDSIGVTLQWVLTEWTQKDPAATRFSGQGRELMRVDMVTGIHGFQDLNFNPLAVRGSAEYGILYLGIGDGGATGEGYDFICHDRKRIWGSVIRINPAGNNSRNGKYGVPPDNPFVAEKDSEVVKEIFVYGFRNPHRTSWDPLTRKMLITDIGQSSIEEINLAVPGGDFGWNTREGTFALNPEKIDSVYSLPADDNRDSYVYPVAQFDHSEGRAISGGYVYRGENIPVLRGKYIFGDVVSGRLMMTDADALHQGNQAEIKELSFEAEGKKQNLEELTGNKRVDLRFGQDNKGELYIFTKADGRIWKITGAR
ncbi:MAG: PQQ-dependent sugar dehydrogenase [Bacteroidia bacterium]